MDVFILAAGKGKRMTNTLWPDVPKCLLPYKGKAILSHIIDSFLNWGLGAPSWLPGTPVFYIAVPARDTLIRSYVTATYGPQMEAYFIEVPDTGVGPISSFMELAMFRDTNGPFVVTVSDCILPLAGHSALPEGNYLGCSKVPEEAQTDYLNVVPRLNSYVEFVEKARVAPGAASYAWSGLALVADAEEYQQHVAATLNKHTDTSEVSYADLFSTFKAPRRTPPLNMVRQDFLDLGTAEKYNAVTKEQNVWAKGDQITYVDTSTGRVVKYFKDFGHAKAFFARGAALGKHLYLPTGLKRNGNFVSYARANGESLPTIGTKQLIELLNDLYTNLWFFSLAREWMLLQPRAPKVTPLKLFAEKTRERLQQFQIKTGTDIEPWISLLSTPLWAEFSHTKIRRIHGDLSLDNILLDSVTGNYTFIDWRPSTCTEPGSIYGDVYYDLAKLWLSLYLDLSATRDSGHPVVRGDVNLLTTFQAWCKLNTFDDMFDYDTIVRQAILLMAAMSGVHSEPIASGFFNLSLKLAQHIDAGNSL